MLVERIGRIGGPAVTFDKKVLSYLMFLARKHDITPEKFVESILRAWSKDSARCGKLKIQCIIKAEDRPCFRITRGKHIVTQTKVNLKLLAPHLKKDLKKRKELNK